MHADHYFGDDFYNYGLLRAAEFLDPRAVWCVEDVDELEQVKLVLKAMANEEDAKVLARQSRDDVGSVGLAAAAGATSFRTSRLGREVDSYAQAMINRGEQACSALNTLEFWPSEGKTQWPTLCYVASYTDSTYTTSSSISRAGTFDFRKSRL